MNDEGLLLGRTKNEFDWSSWRSTGLEIHAMVEARETINTWSKHSQIERLMISYKKNTRRENLREYQAYYCLI